MTMATYYSHYIEHFRQHPLSWCLVLECSPRAPKCTSRSAGIPVCSVYLTRTCRRTHIQGCMNSVPMSCSCIVELVYSGRPPYARDALDNQAVGRQCRLPHVGCTREALRSQLSGHNIVAPVAQHFVTPKPILGCCQEVGREPGDCASRHSRLSSAPSYMHGIPVATTLLVHNSTVPYLSCRRGSYLVPSAIARLTMYASRNSQTASPHNIGAPNSFG